jgi:regulator of nonsense transcripts 2
MSSGGGGRGGAGGRKWKPRGGGGGSKRQNPPAAAEPVVEAKIETKEEPSHVEQKASEPPPPAAAAAAVKAAVAVEAAVEQTVVVSAEEIKKRYNEACTALDAKVTLRKENLRVFEAGGRRPLPANLDSTLKKTSTFISKVKRFAETPRDQLLNEVVKLNLSKFVEEIATSLAEAKLARVSDINTAVKFASVMHQRYPEFSKILETELGRILSSLDNLVVASEQDKALPGRIRSSLRLYGELFWVGVFRSPEAIFECLKKLIKQDDLQDVNFIRLSVIVSFLKQFGEEFLGIIPTKQKAELAQVSLSPYVKPPIVKEDAKDSFCKICKKYFSLCCKKLQVTFNEVKKQQRSNKKVEFYKGSIPEANITRLKELQEIFERLQANVLLLADALDVQSPELVLEDDESDEKQLEAKIDQSGSFDPTKSIFDDEDSRTFYESVPALKATIPAVLLADGAEPDAKPATKSSQKDKEALYEEDYDDDFDDDQLHSGRESSISAPSTPLEHFLKNLEGVSSREEADKLSENFCYLNNKGSRKKLIEFLLNSNKRRTDILPLYSRVIATLTLCYPVILTVMRPLFVTIDDRK